MIIRSVTYVFCFLLKGFTRQNCCLFNTNLWRITDSCPDPPEYLKWLAVYSAVTLLFLPPNLTRLYSPLCSPELLPPSHHRYFFNPLPRTPNHCPITGFILEINTTGSLLRKSDGHSRHSVQLPLVHLQQSACACERICLQMHFVLHFN